MLTISRFIAYLLLSLGYLVANDLPYTKASETRLPYIFNSKRSTGIHPHPFIIKDVDHDTRDEVLYNTPQEEEHNIIFLEDNLLSVNWSLNFEEAIFDFATCDYDSFGYDEIFTIQIVDSLHILKAFDLQRKLFLRDTIYIGSDYNQDGEYDVNLSFRHFYDLNSDGNQDIVFYVHSGFDYIYRGLLAYDIANRKILWYHQTGGSPGSTAIEDLDGDGQAEIIIGTNSPSNGNVTETTDDSHSYLQILDLQGNLLWQKMIGKTGFSNVKISVVQITPSKKFKVISTLIGHGNSTAPNMIMSWEYDAAGQQLIQTDAVEINTRLSTTSCFGNIDSPDWELIVKATSGEMYKYNRSLTLLGKYKNTRRFNIIGRDDYIEGYPYTYAAKTYPVGIEIYSPQFELLARHPDATDIKRVTTGPYGQHEFILVTPTLVDVIEIIKNPTSAISYSRNEVLAFLLGLAVASIFLLIYYRYFSYRTHNESWYSLLNRLEMGILLLKHDNQVIFTNSAFQRITGLYASDSINSDSFKTAKLDWLEKYIKDGEQAVITGTVNLSRDNNKLEYKIKSFVADSKPVSGRSIRCITLEDTTLRTRASSTIEWAAVMQRIAHSIRNPLDILGKQMRRLRKTLKREPFDAIQDDLVLVDSMLEEINRLEETTKTFLVFSRLRKREDKEVNNQEILVRLIEKYKSLVTDSYRLEYKSHHGKMTVSGDAKQLEQAYENLIENALSAMPDGGLLKIESFHSEIIFRESGNVTQQLKIRFSDEGNGIEEDLLKIIFNPGVSKRSSGAGFGLFITKQIIEDHDGNIEMTSKTNSGTTVEVTLPVKEVSS